MIMVVIPLAWVFKLAWNRHRIQFYSTSSTFGHCNVKFQYFQFHFSCMQVCENITNYLKPFVSVI